MTESNNDVVGYRTLSENEVVLINAIKLLGPGIDEVIGLINKSIATDNEVYGTPDSEAYRWVAIGKTHLQQGLMALTRAVARPTSF